MMYLKHMGLSNDPITLKSGSISTKSWILLNTFFQAKKFVQLFYSYAFVWCQAKTE
jgi:hypothetical protein